MKDKLVYKCRYCGHIFKRKTIIFSSVEDELAGLVGALFDTSQEQQMIIIHECDEGILGKCQRRMGIADLIGGITAE